MNIISASRANSTYADIRDEPQVPDTSWTITFAVAPTPNHLTITRDEEVVNAPMKSMKNISPKRVKVRRQKNKAARNARQRNNQRK